MTPPGRFPRPVRRFVYGAMLTLAVAGIFGRRWWHLAAHPEKLGHWARRKFRLHVR